MFACDYSAATSGVAPTTYTSSSLSVLSSHNDTTRYSVTPPLACRRSSGGEMTRDGLDAGGTRKLKTDRTYIRLRNNFSATYGGGSSSPTSHEHMMMRCSAATAATPRWSARSGGRPTAGPGRAQRRLESSSWRQPHHHRTCRAVPTAKAQQEPHQRLSLSTEEQIRGTRRVPPHKHPLANHRPRLALIIVARSSKQAARPPAYARINKISK